MRETKCLSFARLVEERSVKQMPERLELRLLAHALRISAATNDQAAIAKRSPMSPNGEGKATAASPEVEKTNAGAIWHGLCKKHGGGRSP